MFLETKDFLTFRLNIDPCLDFFKIYKKWGSKKFGTQKPDLEMAPEARNLFMWSLSVPCLLAFVPTLMFCALNTVIPLNSFSHFF